MSARDVMNDARIANGINTVQGLEALMEDYGRLSEENSELREKNAELRDDADGYKGVEQALDLLVRDFGIEMDAREGTDYWEDQVSSIRAAMVGMNRICDAVARAVGDDGRRYTVDELAEKLKEWLMPEGYEWPRFESGEPVRFGDRYIDYGGIEQTVRSVRLYRNGAFDLYAVSGVQTPFFTDARVLRPQLKDHDGKPIRVGDVVYGRSDGKTWTVTRIDRGNPAYPVHAVSEHGAERDLKPEWLTHERPSNGGADEDAKDANEDSVPNGGDSWEFLEHDTTCSSRRYCLLRNLKVPPDADECKFDETCKRDLLRRAKKLAGVDDNASSDVTDGGDSWEKLEREFGSASDMQVFAAGSVRSLLRRAKALAGVAE